MAFFLCFLFFLLSSATACDRCVHQTKVAYFSKASALSSGACEYGSMALEMSGGHLAAGVPFLYNGGAGCGACFQMRCKNTTLCTTKGTTIILSDMNENNKTDFVLSSGAFIAMANQGMGQDLLKLGLLDVEYKRIPCEYKNKNLSVRVEETSMKPHYLAVKLLYQGGQTEIVEVDVAKMYSSDWSSMSRISGAIWDTNGVRNVAGHFDGALQFRFIVQAGYDGKWIWARDVLPADWKPGVIYDSGVQINDIAKEPGCIDCDDGTWR